MIRMVRLGAIAFLAVALSFGPAQADALDDAKAAGLVGERIDGYVGVVDSGAPADVKRLVEQINAERQAKYAEIAQKQGAPVQAVAQIAGEKLVQRAGGGEYVMGADGQWRRK
ncbi:MAG TPA: YdbL family protein [Geminicoccaceae bacterium]